MEHNNCRPLGSIDANWCAVVRMDATNWCAVVRMVAAKPFTKALSIVHVLVSLLTKQHEVLVRVQTFLIDYLCSAVKDCKILFFAWPLAYNRA